MEYENIKSTSASSNIEQSYIKRLYHLSVDKLNQIHQRIEELDSFTNGILNTFHSKENQCPFYYCQSRAANKHSTKDSSDIELAISQRKTGRQPHIYHSTESYQNRNLYKRDDDLNSEPTFRKTRPYPNLEKVKIDLSDLNESPQKVSYHTKIVESILFFIL